MIRIQASVSKGWLNREAGMKFNETYYFNPMERREQDLEIAKFLDERFPRYRLFNLESNLVALEYYSPHHLMVGAIQPNLILGMLLGADFIAYPDRDADISEKILAGLNSIADLPTAEKLLQHPLITRWHSEIINFRRSGEPSVIPPFFWDTSGRVSIHGALTSALKFFGEDLFFKIYDDPDFINEFFVWYEDVNRALVHHFAEAADLPVRTLHIGECSGTMLGPAEYEEFLIPSLRRFSEKIAPVRLHHCGDCTHLLPLIAKNTQLAALDTGNGTHVAAVRSLFGNEFQLDLMPPVELFLEGVDPEKMKSWLEQVLEENRGGNLTINYHLEPGYAEENHLILHDLLYDKKLLQPGRSQ
ncbi:MAG: uroporphyrinogen decarboxylase family protein [Sphaerochaeta sp.]|nr:uroporphyrinogen decarboxylase family protein [Sphaerochaeta sp.]